MRETSGAAMLVGPWRVIDHRVGGLVHGHDLALAGQTADEWAFGFGLRREVGFAGGKGEGGGEQEDQVDERFHAACDSGRWAIRKVKVRGEGRLPGRGGPGI